MMIFQWLVAATLAAFLAATFTFMLWTDAEHQRARAEHLRDFQWCLDQDYHDVQDGYRVKRPERGPRVPR